MRKTWLIFDGDNTLWHSEILYDNARERLCAFLSKHGHDHALVHDFQQERDKVLFKSIGYDRSRFSKSFVDTLTYFEPQASVNDIEFVHTLALNVFTSFAPSDEHAGPVLKRLSKFYNLALLTAGDEQIQASRIASFPFSRLFQVIEIVSCKNKENLLNFLSSWGINPKESVVIGDSLRSDILPAIECEVDAIWISNRNWAPVELHGYTLPQCVKHASSLIEVEDWLNLRDER